VIPFRIVKGIPVVSLSLNGKKGMNFLFDTGAAPMTLSSSAIADIGLRTGPAKASLKTPCGTSQIHRLVPKMRVSGYGMKITGSAMALDLSMLSRQLGIPIAGILGYRAMLPQLPMLIDYQTQRITFFLPKNSPHFQKSAEIPLESLHAKKPNRTNPFIIAKLELPDGRFVNANLEIDTGGGAAGLQLNTPFAMKYGLLPSHTKAAHKEMTIGGMGGHACALVRLSVPALIIGDQKIANPTALSAEDPVGTSGSADSDGQIGAAILSQFRVFFGPHRHFVVFLPASQNPPMLASHHLALHSP
jgi:hypothetical protein